MIQGRGGNRPPRLLLPNAETYQREIDWVKAHVKRNFGVTIANAYLEPHTERWMCYTEDAKFVCAVPHETIETLYGLFLLNDARKSAEKKHGNGTG